MSNSTIMDLCSDDQTGQGVTRSRRRTNPVLDSGPSVCPTPFSRNFWQAGYDEVEQGQGHKAENRKGQNHMHIHPMFLHSNATSHKWAFGAMAELLDNAVDEIQNGATFVKIDKISNPRYGSPALLIQDDGSGMDPDTIRRCMSFGFSDKKSKFTIGQYGNGFKTSSMRLGADAIVFSRNSKSRSVTQSVGLLSYTCLRWMGYDKIVVPMVDYEYNSSAGTYGPIIPLDDEHFSSNLAMLLQWSPYSTEEELLKQFDDIGDHGTKLIIYNLWLNDDGNLELDFDSDPEDICINGDKTVHRMKPISGHHVGNLYQNSLRAYASILYRMLPLEFRIILRGRDVGHYNIATDLKYLEFIKYVPHRAGNTEGEVITAIGFLKEAPRVNIHGFNIYHRNRLILPFWRVLNMTTNSLGRGVVGVLEPDFIHPTHNKQEFETGSLFQKLEARLKQMAVEYWNKYCELIGYRKDKKNKIIDATSRASSGAVGSLEESEVNTSDASVSRLVNSVRSSEGFINKRKDREPPVNLKNAKRQLASCGTDVQYINEQPEDSTENMRQASQKIILMRKNKMLRSQLLESEKVVEELDLKVKHLREELDNVQKHGEKLNDELTKICIEAYV